MSTIPTARGMIDSSQLGRVLIHEHVFLMDMEYTVNYRPDFFTDATIAAAAERLNALKAVGIDTIVDLTVLGLGRHIPSLAKVAQHTDLNIIVSTGAYTFDAAPTPFAYYGPGLLRDGPEIMVDHFVQDITVGIGGTAIKAGELKCAIDEPGLTKGVERVMRCVAKANRITGTPITVHTAPRQETGLIVQQIMADEGVDLEDLVIGHCGDATDVDYLMTLADKGSIRGRDRFGIHFGITTQERVATIAALARRGYADRMALSHDCCCWSDYFPSVDEYHAAMPDHHYLHIHNDVLPLLREAGVSEAQLDQMFIANPRRHFEGPAERFARRG